MDPLVAETQALLEAYYLINSMRLNNAIFKLDCLNAINIIMDQQSQIHWFAKALVKDFNGDFNYVLVMQTLQLITWLCGLLVFFGMIISIFLLFPVLVFVMRAFFILDFSTNSY